jgi:hypothetical protein
MSAYAPGLLSPQYLIRSKSPTTALSTSAAGTGGVAAKSIAQPAASAATDAETTTRICFEIDATFMTEAPPPWNGSYSNPRRRDVLVPRQSRSIVLENEIGDKVDTRRFRTIDANVRAFWWEDNRRHANTYKTMSGAHEGYVGGEQGLPAR